MNFDNEVLCPICRSNYNHIEFVQCYKSDEDEYNKSRSITIGKELEIKKTKYEPSKSVGHRARELSLKIKFNCELCGNNWERRLGFHKGTVFRHDYPVD